MKCFKHHFIPSLCNMILRSVSASQEGVHCNNQSINLECLNLRWEKARINTSLEETLSNTVKNKNHTEQGRHHQAITPQHSNSLPFKKQQN